METRRRVHGIDFSGAVDAGRKIWIASGVLRNGALSIEQCARATDRLGVDASPERCLPALREFIARHADSVIGFDFPFGLPGELLREPTWGAFARSFPERFTSADEFRRQCVERAGLQGPKCATAMEKKRVTDKENRTPWSPYNWRLYRQTYYGIGHVLSPLVRARAVCVLPMQGAKRELPWLVEVCPASTLKQAGLAEPYKGGPQNAQAERRAARGRILRRLEQTIPLSIAPVLRPSILDDVEGDALDSVIAAVAAHRALSDLTAHARRSGAAYTLEGYVFT